MKLTYRDKGHSYWLDGRRCSGVSTVAKIPTSTYTLELWSKRMVALGMLYDHTENAAKLHEMLAVDPANKDLGDTAAEKALELAKAHDKADRGTQMHRALELVLLNRPDELLTEQQRRDAVMLRRTLDRYKLTPHKGMVEQFVAYPEYGVTGRFDAVLENAVGTTVLTDLKSGINSILYPQATACQLAMYARAPHVSAVIEDHGEKVVVQDWQTMPEGLDLERGYVLLCEADAEVGTLHEINIEHGWAAAQLALQIVNWRRELDYGKSMVREVPFADDERKCPHGFGIKQGPCPTCDAPKVTDYHDPTKLGFVDQAARATNVERLRELWRDASQLGALDEHFKAVVEVRRRELEGAA